MQDLKHGLVVTATFAPRNKDTLKPYAADFIGETCEFEAGFQLGEGDAETYRGEWAMIIPSSWWERHPALDFFWVPSGDLIETDTPRRRWVYARPNPSASPSP